MLLPRTPWRRITKQAKPPTGSACHPLRTFGQKRRTSVASFRTQPRLVVWVSRPRRKGTDEYTVTSKSKRHITGGNTACKTFLSRVPWSYKIRTGDFNLPLVLCFTLGDFPRWTSTDFIARVEAWTIYFVNSSCATVFLPFDCLRFNMNFIDRTFACRPFISIFGL